MCVRSCKELNPVAYVYSENLCVRTCPDATPYIRLNLQE